MIVYSYDMNGVFVGPYQCQKSPLEPGVFLIPAQATLLAPPEPKEGFAIVFKEGEWIYVEIKSEAPEPEIKKRIPLKEKKELAMKNLRSVRDDLLAASDFALLSDAPQSIKDKLPEILEYRQKLRDITNVVTDATKEYELPKRPF